MNKPTPGPWHVEGQNGPNPPCGYEAFVCSESGTVLIALCGYRPDDRAPNARLIAAAPDLLAALAKISSMAELGDPGIKKVADDAIKGAQ